MLFVLQLALFGCCCEVPKPNKALDGMSFRGWDERGKAGRYVLKYGMTALMFAYLPLSQLAVEIMGCTVAFRAGAYQIGSCSGGSSSGGSGSSGGGGGSSGGGGGNDDCYCSGSSSFCDEDNESDCNFWSSCSWYCPADDGSGYGYGYGYGYGGDDVSCSSSEYSTFKCSGGTPVYASKCDESTCGSCDDELSDPNAFGYIGDGFDCFSFFDGGNYYGFTCSGSVATLHFYSSSACVTSASNLGTAECQSCATRRRLDEDIRRRLDEDVSTGDDLVSQITDDDEWETACATCENVENYTAFMMLAVLILGGVTIALPVQVGALIYRNAPVGSDEDPNSRFDADGVNRVPYSDRMYAEDLEKPDMLANPYLFLFEGFERKYQQYEVIVMATKFFLMLPCVLLATRPTLQALGTLVVVLVSAGMTCRTAPFLDDLADREDQVGKATNAMTIALGLLVALVGAGSGAGKAFLIITSIVGAIGMVASFYFMIAGLSAFQKWLKLRSKTPTFSNALTGDEGDCAAMIATWDLDREAHQRAWCQFWDTVLNGEKYEGTDVAKRLAALKLTVQNKGRKRVLDHFAAGDDEHRVREQLVEHVEGVDVYCASSAPRRSARARSSFDGSRLSLSPRPRTDNGGDASSKTGLFLGKMYVQSMPFTAAIVFDDVDDAREVLFVHKRKDLIALLAMQDEPRVVQIRELRTTLRAFAVSNGCVHYEFSQMETHKVQDGFETYYETDANGNRVQKQRPRMINVQVEMFYHYGTMGIGSRVSSDTFSNGFDPSLSFHDGHGEVLLPNTREMHYFTNMSTTFGAGRLGYDHGPLRGGSVLATILDGRKYPENLQLRDEGVRTWLKMVAEQRHKWWAKRRADEDTLDSAFWLYVYENHFDLDRAGIERYFGEHERGPLRELPSDPEIVPGIDMLFGHMAYVNAGPVAKFWYVFWHDVWANNADVAVFEESADVLDPQRPDAWAFAPAPRHELKKMLAERKLDKWFGDKVLDSLYEGIASYSAGNKSGNPMRATAMEIVDPSTAV